jgi:hypothetical protein
MAEWNEGIGNTVDLLNGAARQSGNATNPIRENIDRRFITTDVAAALTTQVMTSTAIKLNAGDVVTKIAVQFGATAADTPLNWWFALYDTSSTPALLAQTADQTTGAIAANAVKDIALATAQQITTTGLYYVGIMVKATAVPSVLCAVAPTTAINGAVLTGMKVLARTSGTSLTTTAPATIASPTTVVNIPYVICH